MRELSWYGKSLAAQPCPAMLRVGKYCYCYCLLLLPIAIAYGYCPLLLVIAIAIAYAVGNSSMQQQ